MVEHVGKCSNFARCGLAYRGESIRFSGKAVCPECGRPLTGMAPTGSSLLLLLISCIAGAVILAGVGAFFFFTRHPKSPQTAASQNSTATPSRLPQTSPKPLTPSVQSGGSASNLPARSTAVPAPPTNVPATPPRPTPALVQERPTPPTPAATPFVAASLPPASTPTIAPPSTPNALERLIPASDGNAPVSVEQNIDTDLKRQENGRVRSEVLKRIDLMPNLSAGDRQKLYTRVDHAHGMGRVITIPFTAGGRTVGSRDVDQLKAALNDPQVAGLVKNPTVVFVLLGFADKREVDKGNQKISIDRAESISQTLKEKCGLENVTLPIGMGGGAELFESVNFAKNRVVEVWAVVP